MLKRRSDVIGQIVVLQFRQHSANIPHHVPAIVCHVFVCDLDAGRSKLAHQPDQRQPVPRISLLDQVIEYRHNAPWGAASQQ